ncbi:MAG: hypothetical protein QOJ63_1023 [Solirubrobacteraceae bacterium]|nr:hypothetical protein [Solirubrobacteraceae bacterium]
MPIRRWDAPPHQGAVYGPEHDEVALTLGNLGVVQQQLGELDVARAQTERAVATLKRFLGPDHAYARQALAQLAALAS